MGGLSYIIKSCGLFAALLFFCIPASACECIVALAPSLVEVVHTLGMTDRLVGISRFTKFPPEALTVQSIGGYLDPNIEGIIALKPTLVLGLSETQSIAEKLRNFGLTVVTYDHRRIKGIQASIQELGERCGRSTQAGAALMAIDKQITQIKTQTFGKKKARALVLIGGKEDAATLSNLYVSGRDGFYTDLLELAGAFNVFRGLTGAFSSVSREALIKEDPDYIFHIITDENVSANDRKAILAGWATLPYLTAVKKKQVLLLTDYVDIIPGPRFPEVLEKMYQLMH